MRYSVWNYRERRFDYYDAPGPQEGTHVGAPPQPLVRSPMGATPDQAAWKLPTGARKVGSGAQAHGKVASLGDTGTSLLGMLPPAPVSIGIGLAAYLLLRKKR